MRYFTRGFANGEYEDRVAETLTAAYQDRLRAILPKLRPAMKRLAQEVDLHDAVLEKARWVSSTKELILWLVAGTSNDGYRRVMITYRGAMLGKQRIDSLRNVARDREACVLFDEVDVDSEGVFSHRYLFWPSEELTIDFSDMAIELSELPDSRVNLGPAFIEALPENKVEKPTQIK